MQSFYSYELKHHNHNEAACLQCLRANIEDLDLFKAILDSRESNFLRNFGFLAKPVKLFTEPTFTSTVNYLRSIVFMGRRFYDIWKTVAVLLVITPNQLYISMLG